MLDKGWGRFTHTSKLYPCDDDDINWENKSYCSIIIRLHHHFYGQVCCLVGSSKMSSKIKNVLALFWVLGTLESSGDPHKGCLLRHNSCTWSETINRTTIRHSISLRARLKSHQHHVIELESFKSCRADHESAGSEMQVQVYVFH